MRGPGLPGAAAARAGCAPGGEARHDAAPRSWGRSGPPAGTLLRISSRAARVSDGRPAVSVPGAASSWGMPRFSRRAYDSQESVSGTSNVTRTPVSF